MADISGGSEATIRVSDLSLGYGSKSAAKQFSAVEGAQFEVVQGETLSVLGESGSGKSTLIRYLAGRAINKAQKKDSIFTISGEAYTLGFGLHKLVKGSARKLTALAGYLPQDAGAKLDPDLNVGDILFRPIEERLRHFNRSDLGERVAELFDGVGLPLTLLQKFPYELSKGQRQRVAVVRTLLTDPPVVIADEPTLGVDANNRPRIIQILNEFQTRTNSTMVIVSHDIALLEALATNVLVLQQGASVGYGDINEIFRNADHGYVYQLAQALRITAYDEVAAD